MTEPEYEELSRQADEAASRGEEQTARELLETGLAAARQGGDRAFEDFLLAELDCLAGHYESALDHYDAALSLAPERPLFARSRGVALSNLGRYQEAIEWFDKALSVNPNDYDSLRDRGVALGYLGRYEEAIGWMDRALSVNPKDYHSLRERGGALGNLGRHQEAIEWFDKALSVNPNDYHSLRDRGVALGHLGRHEEAIEWFDKALSLNPKDYHSLRDRGSALGNLGRRQEAIEWYDKALSVNPNDYDSLRGRGVALGHLGRYQEAIEWFDKALAVNPNDYDSLRGRGVALGNLRRHHEAIEWFDKALAAKPDDYHSLRGKGVALSYLGKHQEAIESFNRALAVNARDASSLRGKAFSLHALADGEHALEAIRASLEVEPDNFAARLFRWFLEAPAKVASEAAEEERRRAEERRQEEICRARLEAWEALTARSAHRIGNLTFGIRGALRELSFMKLPGEGREELKTITECVERTEAVLGEFKRFVSPLRLNPQPCDPCDVMHRAARRVGDELKTITLECDLPPGETTIVADAQLIGEAVEELLINATRALKGRGTIRLAVRSATEVPAQLLPQRNNRQYVVLSVEDNGPGIKPEHAQRIFEPFFSTTIGGTGLGLSIVRRTVEAHGGVVREVGTYGKGARFEIFLPMKGGDSDGEIQGSHS